MFSRQFNSIKYQIVHHFWIILDVLYYCLKPVSIQWPNLVKTNILSPGINMDFEIYDHR